jgi:2-polyprenyl-3-methyl-5-hydroxy-6-metoxy-1,4-benzoquinol methylase
MPLFLSKRNIHSSEQMDAPNCDPKELENTYHQFSTINALISQWRKIYVQQIRPHAHENKTLTILDIGFGGGDIPIKLAEWADEDGINIEITAIDPDKRAFDFAQKLDHPENVRFLNCSIGELDAGTQKFDFVISNHVLHHLNHEQLVEMLVLSKKLSEKAVIFNDGRRSDAAYLLFNIFSRPVFRSSFITQDGLTSIKRSYTYDELENAVPDDWQVHRLFPFRLLLVHEHS